MADDVSILRAVAGRPLRTARLRDLALLGTNVWRDVDRLVAKGALTRLTHGIYTAPPDGHDGRTWRPELEVAGIAIATARGGERRAALMGASAARYWGAIPRALGVATIAVARAGSAPITLESGGVVRFVPRNLEDLDLILERMSLGVGLVTTPAQTLLDLIARPERVIPDESADAVHNLIPQVDVAEFKALLDAIKRVPLAARELLAQLQEP